MYVLFIGEKKSEKYYGFLNFDKFEVKLQYWVANLCNQHLSGFSSNQFETLHGFYKHIEHVYVTFRRKKYFMTKLQHLFT